MEKTRFDGDQAGTIPIGVEADYHRLRTVVMCLAHVPGLDMPESEVLDAALERQFMNNRWEPFDLGRTREQQLAFAEVLASRGVDVLWADPVPGGIVQQYTRDIAFTIGDHLVLARSQRPLRQRELRGIETLLERIPNVIRLDRGRIEGGDVIVDGDVVIVGLGEETDLQAVEALRDALDAAGVKKEVQVLEFVKPGVIHTDTKLTVVGPGVAIADRHAFAEASWRWITDRYDVIEATPDEVWDVQVNTVSIAPDALVLTSTAGRLASEVERRGIEPVIVDYTELVKLPGSVRCSTLPLLREALPADARA